MGESLYFPNGFPGMEARGAGEGALAALRGRVDAYLAWLEKEASAVAGLRGLLLGGGYGRGEGGVWWPEAEAEPQLYNDMEFYVFAPKVEAAVIGKWIHEGETRFGIEMEFKVMSPEAFARAEPSMFYYDLLAGHVRVAGEASWVDALPERLREARAIPPEEASRLLVNRGMSLLRCLRWSRGEGELSADFCDRITAKLKLALGDAVLCVNGLYNVSCRERQRRLVDAERVPSDWETVRAGHAEGVAFKFRPLVSGCAREDWREPLERLRALWLSTFLWVEGQRLGSVFADAAAYREFRGCLFPGEPRWKNTLRHLRDLRRSPRLPFRVGAHPRAGVWKALACLMAGDEVNAAAELRTGAGGSALEEHCGDVWRRYP
jgi:hypothetical protein